MPAVFLQSYPFAYYEGTSASAATVPGLWPIAVDGYEYMVDTNIDFYSHRWRHVSIPLLRPQQDSSSSPAEASLNPDILWRRAQDSWHGGAGQSFRDRDGGNPARFNTSKGVNPWTFYQLSLLNATDAKTSDANTNLYLAPAGSRLYTTTNQTTKYTASVTADTPSWTTVTSTPAATVSGIASDGKYVYLGYTASGIYLTNTGTTASASWITGTVDKIAYVKSRLMVSGGASIYNVTTSTGTAGPTALPTALFTHANDGFTWVGFAEGLAHIYAAGYAGDKSIVYRIAIKPDASSLDAPIIAGTLPDGEIIRSIGGYLGFIVLGTDKGVRFCEEDGQGNLQIGRSFGPTATACVEGQDKYVWFGWNNYDSTSTGLGRMSLETFTEDTLTGARQPAYASDLMVTGQGTIVDLCTFQSVRVFTVSGLGVYAEDTTSLVASGTFDTGLIGFGLPDQKIALVSDVRTQPLDGSYTVSLAIDGGSFTQIGSESAVDDTSLITSINDGIGQQFELRYTLTRATTVTLGPVFVRWTLKATPGGTDSPAEYIFVPIMLTSPVRLPGGQEKTVDVAAAVERLKGLRRSRRVIVYQEAETSYQVQAEDFEWVAQDFRSDHLGNVLSPNGVMLMQFKRLDPQETS